jgi:hypothetical protein
VPAWRAAAQDEAPGRHAALPSDPSFHATLLDGTTIEGRLTGLSLNHDGNGSASFDGEPAGPLPIDQIVRLWRATGPPESAPLAPTVVLPDGDAIRATIVSADEASLEIVSPLLGSKPVRLPLDRVLGLVLSPSPEPEAFERQLSQIRREPRESEVVWLANGDRRAGRVVRLEPDRLIFDQGAGDSPLDRDGLTAIGFDPTLIGYPEPGALSAQLTFADGSALSVTSLQLVRGRLEAVTRAGVPLAAPIEALTSAVILSPRVAYLSDREHAAVQFTPYLDRHAETYGRDTTWDGRPLRLAGQVHDRGLGMLPRTLIAYRIEPGDARFQALVGLDDRSGELASVVFRVLVDRKEVLSTPPMTPRDPPRPIDVELAGGQLLILVAEFAQRGDVHDYADWAQARIIRSTPASRGEAEDPSDR